MGKKPTPRIRYYLRSDSLTLQVRLSYNYKQFTASLDFWLYPISEYRKLTTSGRLENPEEPNRPKTTFNVDASDLLVLFARSIEDYLAQRIEEGKAMDEDYIKSLLAYAVNKHVEQGIRWYKALRGNETIPEAEGREGRGLTRWLNKNWERYFNPLEGWHEPEQEGGAI